MAVKIVALQRTMPPEISMDLTSSLGLGKEEEGSPCSTQWGSTEP